MNDTLFLIFTIVIFILSILVLVVIHELGHFFAAKKFNIKVLEFGFGLPPRAWGKKIGETIWSLNWLPFGGFVRLLGEDETDKEVLDNKRSFASQNVWKRIFVVVAGVLMNLLLAFFLYYIVLAAQGFKTQIPLISPYEFKGVTQINQEYVLVNEVTPDSPASLAELKKGDRVLEFNGQNLKNAEELINKTREQAGKSVKLTLSNLQGTEQRTVEITPRANPPEGQGPLGVSLGTLAMANLAFETPVQKIFAGPIHSYNLISYSGKILGDTIGFSISQKDLTPVSQSVAGPIGIVTIVKQILSVPNPLVPYLDFMAALSLNLAIVNILPFPGLDGGRFFFLFIEAITKKKTHAVIEKYVHTIGLAILLSLIVLVTISDIKKLIP